MAQVATRPFGWGRLVCWGESESHGIGEEKSPVTIPDFAAGPVAIPAPGFDGFGWKYGDGCLLTEPRTLTRLHGCSVLRSSLGRSRWHVLNQDGSLAARESYHDGEWIGRHIGEPNLRDDAPIEWRVTGEAVLLGHFWAENYAHTLLETVSRLWAFEERPELAELPVVWDLNTPWQKEIAEWLCPGRANPLPANHTRFDTLWVPSFYSQIGSSRASVNWLRRRLGAPEKPGGRRLYISRDDATTRRVENETELLEMLRGFGFEYFRLARMSVEKQRALFAEAETVVMPHGSAAANMLFAGTGTRLIEIVPRSYQHPMFWYIAKWSGHWYGRIVADCDANQDMVVPIGSVRLALERAGVA